MLAPCGPAGIGEGDVPASQGREERRIVVGVDGSPSSQEALRWAVRQAALTGSVVDAVIAWRDPSGYAGYGWLIEDASYQDLAARTLGETVDGIVTAGSGVTVRQHVVEGHPARVLLDAAQGASLLVVGSRGHGGFTEMVLGSVSHHCVQHAPCPVVVIRGRRS
jgi:nucleotide-binding universal stress UspA family protein